MLQPAHRAPTAPRLSRVRYSFACGRRLVSVRPSGRRWRDPFLPHLRRRVGFFGPWRSRPVFCLGAWRRSPPGCFLQRDARPSRNFRSRRSRKFTSSPTEESCDESPTHRLLRPRWRFSTASDTDGLSMTPMDSSSSTNLCTSETKGPSHVYADRRCFLSSTGTAERIRGSQALKITSRLSALWDLLIHPSVCSPRPAARLSTSSSAYSLRPGILHLRRAGRIVASNRTRHYVGAALDSTLQADARPLGGTIMSGAYEWLQSRRYSWRRRVRSSASRIRRDGGNAAQSLCSCSHPSLP